MDSGTLSTASTYLNNLLLARGLLRDGKSLDFAKPTRDTRGQTINLVHDLLLRRDRDQESREHVAQTLKTLRREQYKKDVEIERLQARLAEKDRLLTQAQVDLRNARSGSKKLELGARTLQEQVTRLRTSVGQIKTQCATDIKKRDLQIEKLKTHLQGQQRGNKVGVVAPTITISGGSGNARTAAAFNASVRDLQDPEYSLKQETTDFLTELSQVLSDENDNLASLARGTLRTLKELLGLPEDTDQPMDLSTSNAEELDAAGGSMASSALPVSYEALASDLEATMDTLRTVLTSPNFVSMEEVELRDEEISRLREGWERMETSWRDVLCMMDGWRKRMERTGDTINLDDLKKGFGLGASLEEIRQASKLHTAHSDARRTSTYSVDSAVDEDGDSSNRDSVVETEGTDKAASVSKGPTVKSSATVMHPPEFFDLRPVRGQKLRQLNHNFQSPRRVAFADIVDHKVDAEQENSAVSRQPESVSVPTPTIIRRSARSTPAKAVETTNESLDSTSSRRSRKRDALPPPAKSLPEEPMQDALEVSSSSFVEDDVPQLSMEDKLRIAQVEADEVAKSSAATVAGADSQLDLEMEDDLGNLRSPARKTKIKGRPRRRKSTLSPEELESLLGLE